MKSLTLWCGVKELQFESIIMEIDEFMDEDLNNCIEWLNYILLHQYEDVRKIWKLLPQQTWEHYEKTGFSCNALTLLKQARKRLKTVWNKPWRSIEQVKRIKNKHNPIKHWFKLGPGLNKIGDSNG